MRNKTSEGLGVSNSLLCFTPDCYHRLLDSLYHQCFSLWWIGEVIQIAICTYSEQACNSLKSERPDKRSSFGIGKRPLPCRSNPRPFVMSAIYNAQWSKIIPFIGSWIGSLKDLILTTLAWKLCVAKWRRKLITSPSHKMAFPSTSESSSESAKSNLWIRLRGEQMVDVVIAYISLAYHR